MIYFEKSNPGPSCLAVEKKKANGDYKCKGVIERLKTEFKNKCYICESIKLTSINIEHFFPHEGEKNLKFDWGNLFWSCFHCNNVKSNKYKNILKCTVKDDNVDTVMHYELDPWPKSEVKIEVLVSNERVTNTKDFLLAVYNGNKTELKTEESCNLRGMVVEELNKFRSDLLDYYTAVKNNNEDEKKGSYCVLRSYCLWLQKE